MGERQLVIDLVNIAVTIIDAWQIIELLFSHIFVLHDHAISLGLILLDLVLNKERHLC